MDKFKPKPQKNNIYLYKGKVYNIPSNRTGRLDFDETYDVDNKGTDQEVWSYTT